MELLYFTAPWCVPCRTLGPVMDQVTALPVLKVDVDKDPALAETVNVYSIPTVILTDGPHEINRFTGARSLEYVNQFIADNS